MRFIFHTTSLASSGGSRVITNLAGYLCEQGHSVTIILDKNRIAYPMDERIKVLLLTSFQLKDITPISKGDTENFKEHIHKKSIKKPKTKLRHKYKKIDSINEWKKYLLKLFTFPGKYLVMKKFLSKSKPDLAVSHNMYYFLEHFYFYSSENLSIVLHNSPKQVFIDRTVKSIIPMRTLFSNKKCIGVSSGVSEEMKELMPYISGESQTIYNPLDFKEIKESSKQLIPPFYLENKYIISVSSLAPGKCIHRTIKAFHKLNNSELFLVIVGMGEEEERLKKLCQTLDIENKVIFTGYIENPLPYMKNAELLSFTSDFEGLGLVLVESLACGTPVVSTDCPHGPSEILTESLKPYLVPIKNRAEEDICEDLASCMKQLLLHKIDINDSMIHKFEREYIVNQWVDLANNN
uniref:N-acetylgalactosamine-N,N'-diacetylbacillosaminyl -diphospho-undecaprenol 4-alpha-N-acetylgalactosaminyltransferase n=1 Tax=Aliivibrio wodanis TaxID=80852 RepID=A0A5Q4YX69_9GAMM|nr:N-acetylgalactosamine-N,N'-diacetylbacillosaminyl-diphospho-undecaprenol 4-alpha-N-acetylgalactosaminyltransferase [Aliivibrio wodanis]